MTPLTEYSITELRELCFKDDPIDDETFLEHVIRLCDEVLDLRVKLAQAIERERVADLATLHAKKML